MLIWTLAYVAYDYIITLDREIELFWRAKTSVASVLFFANRYSSLVFNFVLFVIFCFPQSEVGWTR